MITNQIHLFFIFIVNGILIGLLFDFFRITRKVIKTNNFITYLEDILFWIITGIIVLYSIFIFNNGELRLFMFIAILLGTIIYMTSISSYVIKINIKIIKFLKKIIEIIIIPFKILYKLIRKIILKPCRFLFINIRKIFTNFDMKICKNLKILKKEKNIVKN